SRNDFIHIMYQYPAIALGIITQLSLRIRGMNDKVRRLTKVVSGFADLYEESRSALEYEL
ncbi:MAG: hypothetical protein R6U25_03685, partial [Alkalispirochaeta sp.]